jgi:uncharacterized YccA/Bax inhibitor family protein
VALSNPAFSEEMFSGYSQVYGATRSTVMTVQGTVGKTFGLLAILSATAIWSWTAATSQSLQPIVLPAAAIGGFILAMITIFKPTVAPWTAPIYAAFEGVFLGALSYLVEAGLRTRGVPMPGIALQAVSMTCGTLFVMLFLYGSRVIRVTDKLRMGIVAATGAICMVYMISLLLALFGVQVPFLYSASPLGIGISVVIVGVAAFNLLLDFDFIERGAHYSAPKHMEWYGAFGLILTLVWLYLEMLRLLSKVYSRER